MAIFRDAVISIGIALILFGAGEHRHRNFRSNLFGGFHVESPKWVRVDVTTRPIHPGYPS
jgi:hypothetical protein